MMQCLQQQQAPGGRWQQTVQVIAPNGTVSYSNAFGLFNYGSSAPTYFLTPSITPGTQQPFPQQHQQQLIQLQVIGQQAFQQQAFPQQQPFPQQQQQSFPQQQQHFQQQAMCQLCPIPGQLVPGQPSVQMDIYGNTQRIYDSVPTTEASFNLPWSDFEEGNTLGVGNFGVVRKCIYKQYGQNIPVAVKTLNLNDEAGKKEIMKEARIMAALRHKHVVRLIGVCHGDPIRLVLELAPLGSLDKFLKKDTTISMGKIINLMYQVALGMCFLESQGLVHRDLAARNVLLVNQQLAKISDFGMSRALSINEKYYKASAQGARPLEWYAPECILNRKFYSKSDVWSYGITLWEATSRGCTPYPDFDFAQVICMIVVDKKKLDRPIECPSDIYTVMCGCWQYEAEDRPSFSLLCEIMKKYLLNSQFC